MRSIKEIQDRLNEIKQDKRLRVPPANLFINAPLAMVQMALESEQRTLEWVLESSENRHCKSCGWVGPYSEVQSMAGFEFCPACRTRYTGFMPKFRVS